MNNSRTKQRQYNDIKIVKNELANTKYNPNIRNCTIHALKYNCNEIRAKQAKINPTKVFEMPLKSKSTLYGGV